MKITSISLENFRAFDEPFLLDLEDGKNLLLHGENGAGKSSIYMALRRFFEERCDDIAGHTNLFAPAERHPRVSIHIKGQNTQGVALDEDINWDVEGGHPLSVPEDGKPSLIPPEMRATLVDGARRAGFLDYRAMARTHLLAGPLPRHNHGPSVDGLIYGSELKGLEAQLFDLVSLVVLSGVSVPVAGGGVTTLGNLARAVWQNRPTNRRIEVVNRANDHANAFSNAFNAKLPELEAKIAEFLAFFENNQLSVTLLPVALAWDRERLELAGAELTPQIIFRGKPVVNHHQFLNEARLSAFALCLFLAGAYLSDNDYENPDHPRFLVIDDALIGLELQNRLPVLRILSSDAFRHYQIFLLTHDRVWFDLAKGHLTSKVGWIHRELLADEDTGKLIPRQKASKYDIETAETHLAAGDLKAAAVYARSAFEWRLRQVCETMGIKIPFKSDADRIAAGALWDGVVARQREREENRSKGAQVEDFITADIEAEVDTMRSTVLNQLSHSGSSNLVTSEVAAAIATVKRVIHHKFSKA